MRVVENPSKAQANMKAVMSTTALRDMAMLQAHDRKRMFIWNILGWIFAFFGACLAIILMVMFAFFMHYRPALPIVTVEKMKYYSWGVVPLNQSVILAQQQTGSGNYYNSYLYYDKLYTLSFHNPNKKLIVDVEYVEISSYYSGYFTGRAQRTGWAAMPETMENFTMLMAVDYMPMKKNVAYTMIYDLARLKVDTLTDVHLRGRFRVLGKPVFWMRTRCRFRAGGGITFDQSCSLAAG